MEPLNGRRSSHSIDSSKFSTLSNGLPENSETKRMQAKLLMNYYKQNQQIRNNKYSQQHTDKNSYGQYEQSLTQSYQMQQQAKKRRKEEIRQKLAQQYDQMIRFKQEKAKQQKQRVLQLQKRNLQNLVWGRDSKLDVLRKKQNRLQYGKELQMHLELQQINKYHEKARQRQMIDKYQKEQMEKNIHYDNNQFSQFKRRLEFEKRQNQILGIGNSNPELFEKSQSLQLQKGDIRQMKRRQQMLYGSGLEHQLTSNSIKPRISERYLNETELTYKTNQTLFKSGNMSRSQVYNPITNPIQINYKNPYVLRMFSQLN